jgi:hypothetical protein
MVLMTMIARVSDGLPLAASVQDDQQVQSYKYIYIFINLFLHLLLIIEWTDRSKYSRIPKSGKNVIPKTQFSVTAADDYRKWSLSFPVSH